MCVRSTNSHFQAQIVGTCNDTLIEEQCDTTHADSEMRLLTQVIEAMEETQVTAKRLLIAQISEECICLNERVYKNEHVVFSFGSQTKRFSLVIEVSGQDPFRL